VNIWVTKYLPISKNALESALAFERGDRSDLNVTRIQAPRPPKTMSPKDIARIREETQLLSSGVRDDAGHQS
jgi:DNA-binding transcriptional regulator YiaG